MKMFVIALTIAGAASAAAAETQQPRQDNRDSQSQQSQQQEPRDRSERVICRRIQDTGSTIPQRVCLTARQWRTYGDR